MKKASLLFSNEGSKKLITPKREVEIELRKNPMKNLPENGTLFNFKLLEEDDDAKDQFEELVEELVVNENHIAVVNLSLQVLKFDCLIL